MDADGAHRPAARSGTPHSAAKAAAAAWRHRTAQHPTQASDATLLPDDDADGRAADNTAHAAVGDAPVVGSRQPNPSPPRRITPRPPSATRTTASPRALRRPATTARRQNTAWAAPPPASDPAHLDAAQAQAANTTDDSSADDTVIDDNADAHSDAADGDAAGGDAADYGDGADDAAGDVETIARILASAEIEPYLSRFEGFAEIAAGMSDDVLSALVGDNDATSPVEVLVSRRSLRRTNSGLGRSESVSDDDKLREDEALTARLKRAVEIADREIVRMRDQAETRRWRMMAKTSIV
nr:hypothetical protein HK105_001167 [Polyrhizophydium stewartii]